VIIYYFETKGNLEKVLKKIHKVGPTEKSICNFQNNNMGKGLNIDMFVMKTPLDHAGYPYETVV